MKKIIILLFVLSIILVGISTVSATGDADDFNVVSDSPVLDSDAPALGDDSANSDVSVDDLVFKNDTPWIVRCNPVDYNISVDDLVFKNDTPFIVPFDPYYGFMCPVDDLDFYNETQIIVRCNPYYVSIDPVNEGITFDDIEIDYKDLSDQLKDLKNQLNELKKHYFWWYGWFYS